MNQSVPLSIVLLIFAGSGVLYLGYRWVQAILLSARRITEGADRLEAALAAVTTGVTRLEAALAPAAEELKANMQAIPKLLEAVARVGQAQLEVAQQQRKDQEERIRNPFGRQNGPAPQRDVTAANMEDEISQIMRSEGIGRDEAMMRMNPANQRSVWDGNSVFEGWK